MRNRFKTAENSSQSSGEQPSDFDGDSRVPVGQPSVRFPAVLRLIERHRITPTAATAVLGDREQEELASIVDRIVQAPGKVWLDLGCGTGESTLALARRAPDRLVVGVDKSRHRLDKAPEASPDNLIYACLDVSWLVARLAQLEIKVEKIFLLYPNPWPKPQHLQRRWYGHNIFLPMLEICGEIECRTNWNIYAEEMAYGLRACKWQVQGPDVWQPEQSITAFERKYLASGHALWRVDAVK